MSAPEGRIQRITLEQQETMRWAAKNPETRQGICDLLTLTDQQIPKTLVDIADRKRWVEESQADYDALIANAELLRAALTDGVEP